MCSRPCSYNTRHISLGLNVHTIVQNDSLLSASLKTAYGGLNLRCLYIHLLALYKSSHGSFDRMDPSPPGTVSPWTIPPYPFCVFTLNGTYTPQQPAGSRFGDSLQSAIVNLPTMGGSMGQYRRAKLLERLLSGRLSRPPGNKRIALPERDRERQTNSIAPTWKLSSPPLPCLMRLRLPA